MMSQYKNIFLSVLLLFVQTCVTASPLEARHQDSGFSTKVSNGNLAFPEYIAQTRATLAKVRSGNGAVDMERAINGNSPFELKPAESCPKGQNKPYRRGILLTHGLTDSPYSMHSLASFFQENCFRVMAILLPGHGTQPGDLLDVTWQDWAEMEAYGTNKLSAEVEEIFLGGYSTGGALSIYQSLMDSRVRGLFLFSPALKVSPKAALANLHKIYSWLIPREKWIDIKPDKDIYKYESFPMNAAAQIYALTQELQDKLDGHPVKIPVFAAASEQDITVSTSATLNFMENAPNSANKLVLYTTNVNQVAPGRSAGKLERVNSVFPEWRILSAAHTAITLPLEDPHYGIMGEYVNCLHYLSDKAQKYNDCISNPEQAYWGELTDANLKAGNLRRLMANPNFPQLKTSMKKFIDALP
uniref:Serine aminopeptidase S33 domain-containing protein n=1 Tax=Candidatus Nitrotoga fabula TaxID=2182327 RepID=A0A2X0QT22_9PROT|nr:conserved exported protein of unknown function [Candidatus Nitrotoga fabula]